MTRCVEANRPPGGLTVHLVAGHAVDLHIAGVTAGTLHWADARRVEVAPSLPGTASVDGLGWSLDGDLTAQLRAAGVAYVQLVADDRVLMAGDVAWHSGWRGSCQPHQRVVYVSGPPGGPGIGIADVTAVDGTATITLTDGTTHTIKLPPGADGHSPVVGLDGDRLTVDGVPVGESLRGPAGHTPEVIVSGDVVTIDGQSTDPLTSTVPGPPTTLSIGEVATLPPSSPATAQITGEPPSQTLTLGIPRGDVGPASTVPGPPGAVPTASDYLIVGPGRPDTPSTTGGAITGSEPVGAEYRSTDGAGVGAWVWMKRGTKWVATSGDTGWRYNLPLDGSQYYRVWLRRASETVMMRFIAHQNKEAMPNFTFPAGFSPPGGIDVQRAMYRGGATVIVGHFRINEWMLVYNGILDTINATSLESWFTDDPWPTVLPGSPS